MTEDIALPEDTKPSRLPSAKGDEFNPDDYDTVASRIEKFWGKHENGRISTEVVNTSGDVGATRWVVRASVWTDRWEDRDMTIKRVEPDATGIAVEVDGAEGVNATSALENAETSAIGRALANLGFAGNKRPSREEMTKAQRGPIKARDIRPPTAKDNPDA